MDSQADRMTVDQVRKNFPEVAAADAAANLPTTAHQLNQRPQREIEARYAGQIQGAINNLEIQKKLDNAVKLAQLDSNAEADLRKAVELAKTDNEAQALINAALQAKK